MHWLLLLATLFAPGTGADLTRGIRETALDEAECYRVRDLTLVKEDLRIYLTDGYLIFARPIDGRRTVAVFSAVETEGGDAEVLLMPPARGERRSLANYIGAPNLSEHINYGVFVFSDDTYASVTEQLKANPFNRKVPEMGLLLTGKWSDAVRNISTSFETRLALDILSGAKAGFFSGMLNGRKLGNFDVLYDPRSREQIMVGQVASSRDSRNYFDVWTSFEARSFRNAARETAPEFQISDYRINATVDPSLLLHVEGTLKLRPSQTLPVVALDLAREMRLLSTAIDGRDCEFLQRDSMRANLVRNTGNDMVLVIPPAPLEPGRDHHIAFRAEGKVIHDAGNEVYFVGARGIWYPNRWMQFATYDLTFRYPPSLDLVTPGQTLEDKTDSQWRITRRRTDTPVRMAGFNLGRFERVQASRAGYTVEVCANRSVERALQPAPVVRILPPPSLGRNRRPDAAPRIMELPIAPDPRQRLREMASDVASAMEFMSARFGPPVLRSLAVSPVPGTFGQGFPGLLYVSTLSYLGPEDKPIRALTPAQRLFFAEILTAHETAHQWWGNLLGPAGYHDDWLMEALANYSALLFLEKRRGTRVLDATLDGYRQSLLAKTEGGGIVDSIGPIILGHRLETSTAPEAYRHITYGKGSWIIHMLRRRMGDERFFAMLSDLRHRYEYKPVSTEQFRRLAARFLPPKSGDPELTAFFDEWIYGTGIPALKLDYAVKGKRGALRLSGAVSQSEVADDFSVWVPIEIQFARGRPITHWVQTSDDPVAFNVPLRQAPNKVLLDPALSVLRR